MTLMEIIINHSRHLLNQLLTCENFNFMKLPQSYSVDVPHVKQLYTWDCGIACVLMILKTLGINNCNLQSLEDLCSTKSIWTVDLAHLLQKFSATFSYFTLTLGADPTFSMESFYKDQLCDDLERVNMLFRESTKAGIQIQCRSIKEAEIGMLILSGKFIAVVLVDQHKLKYESHSWLEEFSGLCSHDSKRGYIGHFLVICGYNTETEEFEVRDPSSSQSKEIIHSKHLKNARKSFGTDEDLLLVSLENKCVMP